MNYLTVYGRSGTQCPSTYMASSIRNGWEPSAMSPLLGRKQLSIHSCMSLNLRNINFSEYDLSTYKIHK